MNAIRWSETLSGVVAVLWGILIALFFLVLPTPVIPSKQVSGAVLVWVGLTIIPLSLIEFGAYRVKWSRGVRQSALNYTPREATGAALASTYGTWKLYSGFLGIAFVGLLALVGYGLLLSRIGRVLAAGQMRVGWLTIAPAALYLIYGLLRRPVISVLGKANVSLSQLSPSYTLLPDGILLTNLFSGKNKERYNVHLLFRELDEVRVLSDLEAEDLLKYRVGPDLALAAEATQDMYRFLKGDIPRPRSLVRTAVRPGGMTIFLRGPEIYYLVAVANEDCGDLAMAFQASKEAR